MAQSWRLLARDVGRLLRTPKAWVVVLGVLITPSLYAWVNIIAFWDPYGNTRNIEVAIVNLDEGASSDLTGDLDVGQQVVDQLKQDTQLGWEFYGEEAAQEAVKSGDAYAAIVIPADFSRDLLSITSGDFTQPTLQYYVNEKANAVAPKITDAGASGLDTQITQSFTEQVASAAASALRDVGDTAETDLTDSRDRALNAFAEAADRVESARDGVSGFRDRLTGARSTVSSASATLDDVDNLLTNVRTAIAQAQATADEAQQQVITFTESATSAYVDSATQLADASAGANATINQLTGTLGQVGTQIDSTFSGVAGLAAANGAAIAQIQSLVDGAALDPAVAQQLTDVISALQERNGTDQQLLAEPGAITAAANDSLAALIGAADGITGATRNAQDAATELSTVLSAAVPDLTSAMAGISASAGRFSAAVEAQQAQIGQAQQLLAGLDTQLDSASTALGAFDENLGGIQDGLETARADIIALNAASVWDGLSTLTGLDSQQIGQFVASPVDVQQITVFPVGSYGSAMAALFTNLSFWVGAFVLMIIFKTEVDTDNAEGITVRQAYLGRFYLFSLLVALQSLVVCVGSLVIGVQTVNPFAFVATGVFIGQVYLSIVYALCVAFGHIGRGLCVLLIVVQIPGTSGLYPIETMPGFFRAVYPLLPFTYGIEAMRETIGGFYHADYWRFVGTLVIYLVVAFAVGILLRSRLSDMTLMFNRRLADTNLLNGENVQVTRSGYRLSDIIRALASREDYRRDLDRRAYSFTDGYGRRLKLTALVGAAGFVVLGVIASLIPGGKPLMLGIWVSWCLLIMGLLVAFEYARHSFEAADDVAEWDDERLRRAILERGTPRQSAAAGGAAGATALLTSNDDYSYGGGAYGGGAYGGDSYRDYHDEPDEADSPESVPYKDDSYEEDPLGQDPYGEDRYGEDPYDDAGVVQPGPPESVLDQPDSGHLDQPDSGNLDQPDPGNFDQPHSGHLDQPDSGNLDQPDSGHADTQDLDPGEQHHNSVDPGDDGGERR